MPEVNTIPRIEILNDNVVITISKYDLKFVTENDPENSGVTIIDADKFLEEFALQLKEPHSSNATELGLSELQMTIDACIGAVIESGSESVEIKFSL